MMRRDVGKEPDRCYLDPQKEVARVFGRTHSRDNCVIGFALGVRAAGYVVLMRHRPSNKRSGSTMAIKYAAFPVEPDYYLLGLLWAKGLWPAVGRDLSMFNPVALPHPLPSELIAP